MNFSIFVGVDEQFSNVVGLLGFDCLFDRWNNSTAKKKMYNILLCKIGSYSFLSLIFSSVE